MQISPLSPPAAEPAMALPWEGSAIGEKALRLSNLPDLGRLLLDFSRFFLVRRREIDAGVNLCLEAASALLSKPHGGLSPENLHRLREYALLGMALGETFCVLRGRPMLREESEAFLHISLFAPFYDDLFDAGEFREERILSLMEEPAGWKPETFAEAMLVKALEIVHAHVPDRGGFDARFRELFEAQKENMMPAPAGAKPAPGSMLRKGGVSALLYRSFLRHPLRPGEENAFYHLGSLIQFMDDIFDVEEDFRAGRATCATLECDMERSARWYAGEMRACLERFRGLDYAPADLRRFLFRVNFILARGSVCLERFAALQRERGGEFHPGNFARGQLLVDMEKPGNFLRNLGHCLRFG